MPTAAHIAIDPRVRGSRPHLAGSRVAVADIVVMHLRLAQPLEEIAARYDLPLAALHVAMAYYDDHRDEIDRAIDEDEAFREAFRRGNPSPLLEKLKSLGRAE